VLLLGDIERDKDFAILSHGPPSMREARLGLPEQPSFLLARNGGPPAQPANMTSSAQQPRSTPGHGGLTGTYPPILTRCGRRTRSR
jgi:hypothetical protein